MSGLAAVTARAAGRAADVAGIISTRVGWLAPVVVGLVVLASCGGGSAGSDRASTTTTAAASSSTSEQPAASTESPETSSTDTTETITPAAPVATYTCTDVASDTATFIGHLEAHHGPHDVYADPPGIRDAAPPLVAEVIEACSAAWASAIANDITGSTYRALESIIASQTAASATTSSPSGPAPSSPAQFATPSDNIGCAVTASDARCDIRERDWSAPPPGEECMLDWGQTIEVGSGAAGFVCVGDWAGGTEVLPYGRAVQIGPMRCDSTESGVTCRNTTTGRGFLISRGRYELF